MCDILSKYQRPYMYAYPHFQEDLCIFFSTVNSFADE